MTVPRGLALAGCAALTVVVGAWLALTEVFWLPLRVNGLLVPVSLVAAVAGNLLLPVVIAAMVRRPEGDLVITGGGATGTLNLVFLLAGVLAAAVAVGRILGGPAPAVRPGARDRARAPVGSGNGGAR